ncbi:MAG: lipopolysaccharide/colanic/teichoic acid biosynthesis glycosyltransferase [Polaribacter sp.]|jgi:lipopolysaccharide/colanic/teichoic acid biosynthesis glycosyltransferase
MTKRLFDILFSVLGIFFLLPLYIITTVCILLDSKGGVFFFQTRVGKNNQNFKLFKFRTMKPGSDKKGLITVGGKDDRVTKVGYYLRKYKLDELPQLFNVLNGTMSFVGPRPEVRKYVAMYNKEQLKVLTVQPGITDYASIEYSNENAILARSENPDEDYINLIMPAKLKLNLKYISEMGVLTDVKLIVKTILKIVS